METLKEIVASIRDWLRERVVNPFFAAFIVAWLAVNWRVVLILLGEMTAYQKLVWLDQRLYPEAWHWPFFGLIWPSALALIYVLVTPPIFRALAKYHRLQQHKSTTAMLEADKIEPISPDRAELLIRERIKARADLKSEVARFAELEGDYLDQIERLQKVLAKRERGTSANEEGSSQNESQAPEDDAVRGKVWKLNPTDFIGIAPTRLEGIARHGLRDDDAKALYAFKDHERFDEDDLLKSFGLARHDGRVMLSRLKGLKLLNELGPDSYSLSSLGLQALDFLKQKGFSG